jgi:SAM-dependent methyltransferase
MAGAEPLCEQHVVSTSTGRVASATWGGGVALVDPEQAAALLVCPRCHGALEASDGGRRCSTAECPHHRPKAFPTLGRWPVVVDFERSVVDRSSITQEPARLLAPGARMRRISVSALPARVRDWWKPRNKVAEREVQRLLSSLPAHPLVLVVGGGTVGNGVDALYRQGPRLIAFDVYGSPLTQFVADAHEIPLETASVDAVIVQAVLEHVIDPDRVVAEIHRVLRPGGLVYAETPFMQQVHAGPYDFRRFTSSGHRWLFRGFDEIAAGAVAGPGTQLLWSIDHLARGLTRSQLGGRLARAAFSWLRVLDRYVPGPFSLDAASACFFLGRRAERQLEPREIIDYYRGAQRPRAA